MKVASIMALINLTVLAGATTYVNIALMQRLTGKSIFSLSDSTGQK